MHWDFKPVGDCTTQGKEKLKTPLLFQTDFHIAHYWMHTAAPYVLSSGLSHSTECYIQDQLKDTARITSWVNWRYNHKGKGLVTTFKLL